jgi:hypothetical protein
VLHCVGGDPPRRVTVYVVEVNHPIILAREGGARMPDLEDVTQRFIADTTPYVAALERAASAARQFAEANAAAAATAQALRSELGDTAGAALVLVSAEQELSQAMAEKTAEVLFQSAGLNDLRANMGYTYIATRLLAAGEADLTRQLALTAGLMGVVIRANGDLALQSMYAAQALDVQQKALTSTSTDLVLASAAAHGFSQAEYDLIVVMAEKTAEASRQGSQLKELSGDFAQAAAASTVFSAAENKAAANTQKSTGIMIGWWRLTGNAIHWILAGTAEYLAVALPGTIALAAGAFVMYQGVVEDVARRTQSLYTATEATANIFNKTTGDVLGMGHAMQTAQNAANPIAYQLLGNYVNIARQHMGLLATAGLQVAHALGEFGARIQVDLISHGAQFDSLLSKMVPDLVEFGQILGNIGHALLNFASDMPGLAEVLLKIADAISKIILVISELPRWFVLSFMAMEEFQRWGGLVATGLGRLGLALGDTSGKWYTFGHAAGIIKTVLGLVPTILFNAGSALSMFGNKLPMIGSEVESAGNAMARFGGSVGTAIAGLGTGWTLAIGAAAVGLGILIDKLVTAQDSAQKFVDVLEKDVSRVSNVNALDTIATSIGKLNEQLDKTPKTVAYAGGEMGRFGMTNQIANTQVQELTKGQAQLLGQMNNVAMGADKISRAYGLTFAQSLALADVAGVKLSSTQLTLGKNANIAGAQIEGLVQGYKGLDQVGGALGTDMNALAIQSGLAGTKVSSLNSALDQFVTNGTSVTNALATMNQDLTQIGNVGVAVGGAFRVFTGQTAIGIDAAAKSLSSFSGTGAQTWQNYNAAINQAQSLTDSFRVAAAYGGVSQRQFTGSIADTVASLLPFTTHSATAVSELSMIAQEAGGPATSNFKTLKNWVDQNTISGGAFNKAVQEMTGQMDNAGSAAKEFASDLQSQMQSQMASALLGANNLNGAVKNFQNAVIQAGGHISASSPQYQALYKMLTAAGLSAQQAKNEIQTMQSAIDAMHSKTITVGVNAVYSQTGAPPPYVGGAQVPLATLLHATHGQHGMTVGFQGGGMVGGSSGVDAIHAMLTAGEAVLNAQAVAALGGPMGVHALNNQPSQGVLTTGGAGAGATALGLNLVIRNEMDGQTVNTNQRQANLIYNRRNPSNNLALRAR